MDKNVYEEGTLKYYSFFKDSKEMEEEQMEKELLPCDVAVSLQIFGTKIKILVVKELLKGTKRFSELNRAIPCTQKVLNILIYVNWKKIKSYLAKSTLQSPLKVEYSLTEIGKTIEPIINLMNKWGAYYRNFIKSI